ncbi:MAG: hypothetical protein A2358_01800 [Candidatus Staskawiczbacteria bacterium RIFOXYB1_FULL_37_44]|uniref:Uncharacterized protein n=1 Tax=Candidatus Staskawiczbacteria bacterium RIFOXYB1_FULL_37_44 TaxID=1802223 RepID=A0A1G2IWA2_9BACT|nr:MAG: hypothetical protein A2358_01800 [Candidatus Staskawiczbacteria bacterium RIFOXYB1_FULL_37_44]
MAPATELLYIKTAILQIKFARWPIMPASVADGDLRRQGNDGAGTQTATVTTGAVPIDPEPAAAPVRARDIAERVARAGAKGPIGLVHMIVGFLEEFQLVNFAFFKGDLWRSESLQLVRREIPIFFISLLTVAYPYGIMAVFGSAVGLNYFIQIAVGVLP